MEDQRTKIKSILLVILAWLVAIAFLYIVLVKIRLFLK